MAVQKDISQQRLFHSRSFGTSRHHHRGWNYCSPGLVSHGCLWTRCVVRASVCPVINRDRGPLRGRRRILNVLGHSVFELHSARIFKSSPSLSFVSYHLSPQLPSSLSFFSVVQAVASPCIRLRILRHSRTFKRHCGVNLNSTLGHSRTQQM